MQTRDRHFIGGEWVAPSSTETIDVISPSTEEVIARVPAAKAADIDRAVKAARAAFDDGPWPRMTVAERVDWMRKLSQGLQARMNDVALAVTTEMGCPITVSTMAQALPPGMVLDKYAEVASSHPFEQDRAGLFGRVIVRQEPVGVCGLITPWNWPANQIACKVAPALAAGCTVVVKPAEATPYSALALAELAHRAGFPPGVLNVVTGDAPAIGREMCANPDVRKLSFTGSTEVGRILMAQAAPTIKKLSLELGGNAPFIVFDDADLDAAVQGAIASKYRNTGQTCVCANRLLVQKGVYDAFVAKLVEAVKKLRVGDGLAGPTEQGPLIDEKAVAKVEEHVADALAKGGRIALGGKRHALGGTFFEPTIITHVTPAMAVAREETFGPVAPIFAFDDEKQAIRMANDTEFGLASYFYTRDLARAFRVAEGLEYGIVGLNTGLISTEVAPFGGVKESGSGREGSKYGILDYTELKYLCIGGIEG